MRPSIRGNFENRKTRREALPWDVARANAIAALVWPARAVRTIAGRPRRAVAMVERRDGGSSRRSRCDRPGPAREQADARLLRLFVWSVGSRRQPAPHLP